MRIASAYQQLAPFERSFVDAFVQTLEREAQKRFERLPVTLTRTVESLEPDKLDERSRVMFEKPMVAAAIQERVNVRAAASDLTAEWIIRQYQAIAGANMSKYVTVGEDGFPAPDLSMLAYDDWIPVRSIDAVDEYGRGGSKRRFKFQLENKLEALAMLAKITGLDKSEHADYLAYKATPNELLRLSSGASVEDAQSAYAQFIDG